MPVQDCTGLHKLVRTAWAFASASLHVSHHIGSMAKETVKTAKTSILCICPPVFFFYSFFFLLDRWKRIKKIFCLTLRCCCCAPVLQLVFFLFFSFTGVRCVCVYRVVLLHHKLESAIRERRGKKMNSSSCYNFFCLQHQCESKTRPIRVITVQSTTGQGRWQLDVDVNRRCTRFLRFD